MKRLLSSYLLSIGLVLTLSACGNDAPLPQPPTEPTLPTTPPPPVTPPPPTTPPPPPPTGSGIDGTVTAPSGGDVSGTIIGACGSEECNPDVDGTTFAQVTQAGPSAPYTVAVAAGQYMVIAIKDANSSGEFDAGDYVGGYSADGQNLTPVSPPETGIDIQMTIYSGPESGGASPLSFEAFPGELPHFSAPR